MVVVVVVIVGMVVVIMMVKVTLVFCRVRSCHSTIKTVMVDVL